MRISRIEGLLPLRQQLKVLQLKPVQRKRMHRRMGRQVIKHSRQRIRQQKDLQGQPWAGRKRGKRKMLTKLMRGQNVKVYANSDTGKVTWTNSQMGKIARRHQEGIPEIMTARMAAKRNGTPDYEGDCTEDQAKALVKAGFRIYAGKRRGKVKTRRASKRWILQNMTLGQAGMVLRLLLDRKRTSSWEVPVEKRSFLGVTPRERREIAETELKRLSRRAVKGKR